MVWEVPIAEYEKVSHMTLAIGPRPAWTTSSPPNPPGDRRFYAGVNLPLALADAVQRRVTRRRLVLSILYAALSAAFIVAAGIQLIAVPNVDFPNRMVDYVISSGIAIVAFIAIVKLWPAPSDAAKRRAVTAVGGDLPGKLLCDQSVLDAGGQAWLDAQKYDHELFVALAQDSELPARETLRACRSLDQLDR